MGGEKAAFSPCVSILSALPCFHSKHIVQGPGSGVFDGPGIEGHAPDSRGMSRFIGEDRNNSPSFSHSVLVGSGVLRRLLQTETTPQDEDSENNPLILDGVRAQALTRFSICRRRAAERELA